MIKDSKKNHSLVWFVRRIWKKIYRDKGTCDCETCKDVEENGMIVHDVTHANYLHQCGWTLNILYRDKKWKK